MDSGRYSLYLKDDESLLLYDNDGQDVTTIDEDLIKDYFSEDDYNEAMHAFGKDPIINI